MRTYKNTLEQYGEPGPWESESREQLADEMTETFILWADEKVQRMEQDDPESLWDTGSLATGQTFAQYFAAEMRAEFIDGLEEVE